MDTEQQVALHSSCSWSLFLLFGTWLLLSTTSVEAQKNGKVGFDTLYVRDFSHIVTGRIYSSTKDNDLLLGSGEAGRDLVYRPNNRFNLGIGASYRALTLNIGFPVPFVNNDNEVRGRTTYFDAQANLYTRRTATNVFLQYFGGYYIRSHELAEVNWIQTTTRPYRPDLRQFNLGISTVRILNSDRFSYRASFNQDAWQRRSQGTWLVGGYATYFSARADSSLIPTALQEQYKQEFRLRRAGFTDLGALGGGAYTLVVREHFFITLSGVVGIGANTQLITFPVDDGEQRQFNIGPGWHAQLRSSMGYNSRRYYVGVSYNQEQIGYLIPGQQRFSWSVRNIRFNVVKRFNMRIGFMDRGIRWLKRKVPEPIEQVLPKEIEEDRP